MPTIRRARLLVALLGGRGHVERARDALTEQLELGAELGHRFGRAQTPSLALEQSAGPVETGEHLGDPFEQLRAHRGVVDLEAGDDLAEQPKAIVDVLEHLGDRGDLCHLGDRFDLLFDLVESARGTAGGPDRHAGSRR